MYLSSQSVELYAYGQVFQGGIQSSSVETLIFCRKWSGYYNTHNAFVITVVVSSRHVIGIIVSLRKVLRLAISYRTEHPDFLL